MTDYIQVPAEQFKDWYERINTIAIELAFNIADEMEPLLSSSPAQQGEPVGWQFYVDGKWWNGGGLTEHQQKDLEEAGYPTRDVYAAPTVQTDPWAPSGAYYDHAIHHNPDAKAWADLFVVTFPGLADKRDLMMGWFANAMMAMHDYLMQKQAEQQPEPISRNLRAAHTMILNALDRDAADGRVVRGEMAAELRSAISEQTVIRHDWDDQDKCRRCGDRDWYASATCTPKKQPILNLTEAARSLGVAQAKEDQDAIDYWSAEVARFERESRQSTACVGCEGSPAPKNSPCAVCGQKSTPDVSALVAALAEAIEEARLTLEVMQGRGNSVGLTLAIIDRALAAYRKGGCK